MNILKKIFSLIGIFIIISLVTFFTTSCSENTTKNNKIKKELTISAAASLKAPMSELKAKFQEQTGIYLIINTASSGTLQKQIEQGAPVDVFLSASTSKMDKLEEKGLIDNSSRINLLRNSLVLIVSDDFSSKISSIYDLEKENVKLTIGHPESVPAGQYAKESLENLNIWKNIERNIVFSKDVLQILRYVERGEIPAGILYYSDATKLKNGKMVQVFEDNVHSPIIYPVAIVGSSKNKTNAKSLIDFLKSEEAALIFEKYGFEMY